VQFFKKSGLSIHRPLYT